MSGKVSYLVGYVILEDMILMFLVSRFNFFLPSAIYRFLVLYLYFGFECDFN